MINPELFYNELKQNGITFFAGVPDSLLKDICAYITAHASPQNHVITANEGAAVGLATGYHLATGNLPMVYMQNSGLGNSVNPLISLADPDVYAIPMLLMIGWRGEPNTKDEPQHKKQGRITLAMLESMEIPYQILDEQSDYKKVITEAVKQAKQRSCPVAIVVKSKTFNTYKLEKQVHPYSLNREDALQEILSHLPENAVIVSTTGKLSRELFELREKNKQSHQTDFLTVGSMGHTSQIATGIAMAKPDCPVFCFDGDGSAIMHLGSYAITGAIAPPNLKMFIFNNASHDSVGGQPTIANQIDFYSFAQSVNLFPYSPVSSLKELQEVMPQLINNNQTTFLEIKIKGGARADLGRPTTTPLENKKALQQFLDA
jgi:phosphonopyruvate decarboxylase